MSFFKNPFISKNVVNEVQNQESNNVPETYFETDKIHSIIIENIMNAKQSIHLAMARFTDETIFKEILERSKTGVKVDIIVSDNDDNQKIDFSKISEFGGDVTKIPLSGYGSMNNKFMVIDSKIVLNGSYNYTINARKNNDENIQVNFNQKMAEQFIEEFHRLKMNILTPSINIQESIKQTGTNDLLKKDNEVRTDDKEKSYEDLLKLYIEGEINQTDDKELVRAGKEASENNTGDHSNLTGYFQSILYKFHDDANLGESKKESLIMRLNEQKEREFNRLNKLFEDFKENSTLSLNNIIESIKTSININKNKINKNENEIETKLKKSKLISDELELIKESIKKLKIEGLIPDTNRVQLIGALIFFIFVLIWIFVFYTSVGYYLSYLAIDIQNAMNNNIPIDPPGIVDFNAIQKAKAHGLMGLFGCMVFIFVPLAYGIINTLTKKNVANKYIFIGLVILIDVLIAAKVIDKMTEAEVRMQLKPEGFSFSFFSSQNNYLLCADFWMILLLGTGTIFVFNYLFNIFIEWYENKRPSILQKKLNIEIEALENNKKSKEEELIQLNSEIGELKANNIELQRDIEQKEIKIINEKSRTDNQIINKKTQLSTNISLTEKVTELYIGKLKSGNYVLSMDVLRHRISKFLEGWSNYLFEHYAQSLANQKLNLAITEKNSWLNNIAK